MIPIVRLADQMHLAETGQAEAPDVASSLNHCLDSASLLTSTNLQIEQLRREHFRPVLPAAYKSLVHEPEVPTEYLFGDLETRIKEADEKLKLEGQLRSQDKRVFMDVHNRQKAFHRPTQNQRSNTHYASGNRFARNTGTSYENRSQPPQSSAMPKNVQRFPKNQNAATSGKPQYKKWPKRKY